MVYLHKKSLAITSFWKNIQTVGCGLGHRLRKNSSVYAHSKAFLSQSLYSVGKFTVFGNYCPVNKGEEGKGSKVHCANHLFSYRNVRKLTLHLLNCYFMRIFSLALHVDGRNRCFISHP